MILVDLDVLFTDLFEAVDMATVTVRLLPTTTDVADYSDAAQVYLDIQPSAIFLQIDFILEILGVTTRWTMGVPLARWTMGTPVVRWKVVDMFTRWVMLETRRWTWRS
jgi:hypothetical protein